ncbi:hypothetical protein JCM6882_007218 [Rhodosporidiobolus microsporus]
MATAYNLILETPVQCEMQELTWSGEAGVNKSIFAWVGPNDYFSEQIRNNLSAAIGKVEWMCDFPAGANIAFEIMSPGATSFASTPFFQVQPGKTDACLFKNPGQMAPQRMAALASSLSSASPQLFTGYLTSTSSSATSSSALPTSTSETSSVPAPSSSSSQSDSGINGGAVAGGVVGGLAAVLAIAAVIFFCLRRRNKGARSSSSASRGERVPSDDAEGSGAGAAAAGGGGFFRSMSVNPVDAWRKRVVSGRPASAFTRRSRAFSFGTSAPPPAGENATSLSSPLSSSGLPPPVLSGMAAATAAQNPFASTNSRPSMSQGPRAGVPELSDEGASQQPYSPFGTSQGGMRGAGNGGGFPPSQYGELADPSSFERGGSGGGGGGGVISYPPVPSLGSHDEHELLADGAVGVASPVLRPPTRLTTPGGATSYGGEGGRRGSVFSNGEAAPYASYSR